MRKGSVKYIIIGIGIGMMLTSSFDILYNNYIEGSDLEEITVTYTQNPYESDYSNDNNNYENDKVVLEELKTDDIEEEIYYHEVVIRSGMNTKQIARLLEEDGIIEDASEFVQIAQSLKMTTKLVTGKKNIPYGSTIEEILNILSNSN